MAGAAQEQPRRGAGFLRLALKAAGLALALGLAAWMVWRLDDRAALAAVFREALHRPLWLAAGFAALGVSLACGTQRWRVLLRAFEVPLHKREAWRLYLAGHFLSIFAAGSTGGDVVKAAIVAARFPGRRMRAVLSIVVERIIGLQSLVFPLGAACIMLQGRPGAETALRVSGVVIAILVVGIVAWIALFLPDWAPRLARSRNPVLRRLVVPWRLCRAAFGPDHKSQLNAAFDLSIANHVVAAFCGAALARAAGAEVPLLPAMAAMLLANAVALVPVTPGGLGLRESCAAVLLVSLGADETRATAAGLLLFGVILVWAAIGAAAWFAIPRRDTAST